MPRKDEAARKQWPSGPPTVEFLPARQTGRGGPISPNAVAVDAWLRDARRPTASIAGDRRVYSDGDDGTQPSEASSRRVRLKFTDDRTTAGELRQGGLPDEQLHRTGRRAPSAHDRRFARTKAIRGPDD